MFSYYDCCVSYSSNIELNYIIDNSIPITYNTFLKHVDKESLNKLSRNLGYVKGCSLSLKTDWHVGFFKSKTPLGEVVYYLRHSCIEYVFKKEQEERNI